MIIFSEVTKFFGTQPVLSGVNFHVPKGEFACLIGKSGIGKSTIMHLMIGAENPSSGKIMVKGEMVSSLSPSQLQIFRRGVGVVFQDYKLLNNKTLYENVAFSLEVTGELPENIPPKTLQALETVGMAKLKDRYPNDLSGGEKQRIAIARAIVHAPELLIADEPTGNLDPENASAIAQLLLKLNEQGTTIMLTTHNPSLVKEVSPRILIVEDGKISKDLAKGALFPNYQE
jgi:cell division transport system ATP-binding protein